MHLQDTPSTSSKPNGYLSDPAFPSFLFPVFPSPPLLKGPREIGLMSQYSPFPKSSYRNKNWALTQGQRMRKIGSDKPIPKY